MLKAMGEAALRELDIAIERMAPQPPPRPRSPVSLAMGVNGCVVVCDDGAVFTCSALGDGRWEGAQPIPGSLAARGLSP